MFPCFISLSLSCLSGQIIITWKENRGKPRNQPLKCDHSTPFPSSLSLSNPHLGAKSTRNELSSANSPASDRWHCSSIGGHFSTDPRHCPMFSLPTISQPGPIRLQRCPIRHELLLLQPLRNQSRLRRMKRARYTNPQQTPTRTKSTGQSGESSEWLDQHQKPTCKPTKNHSPVARTDATSFPNEITFYPVSWMLSFVADLAWAVLAPPDLRRSRFTNYDEVYGGLI